MSGWRDGAADLAGDRSSCDRSFRKIDGSADERWRAGDGRGRGVDGRERPEKEEARCLAGWATVDSGRRSTDVAGVPRRAVACVRAELGIATVAF